jgi:hypothetical protein
VFAGSIYFPPIYLNCSSRSRKRVSYSSYLKDFNFLKPLFEASQEIGRNSGNLRIGG